MLQVRALPLEPTSYEFGVKALTLPRQVQNSASFRRTFRRNAFKALCQNHFRIAAKRHLKGVNALCLVLRIIDEIMKQRFYLFRRASGIYFI